MANRLQTEIREFEKIAKIIGLPNIRPDIPLIDQSNSLIVEIGDIYKDCEDQETFHLLCMAWDTFTSAIRAQEALFEEIEQAINARPIQ